MTEATPGRHRAKKGPDTTLILQNIGFPSEANDPDKTVIISRDFLSKLSADPPTAPTVVHELSARSDSESTGLVAFDEERSRSEKNRVLLREDVVYHLGGRGALFERVFDPSSDLSDISVSSEEGRTTVEYKLSAEKLGPFKRRAALREVLPAVDVQVRDRVGSTTGRLEMTKDTEVTVTKEGAVIIVVYPKK